MGYKLNLEIFEGPLDLLLYLIKKDEIDIYNIPIAKVAEQYLEYIEMMKMLDLDIVGDFLVMAATLIQIKSKMLLPQEKSGQEDEELDPRDELVKRLLEYKKFKEIADQLKNRESARQAMFTRPVNEELKEEWQEEAKEVYFEVTLFDLINAFSNALRSVKKRPVYEVETEEYTVDQKIHEILHLLVDAASISLTTLFNRAKSKLEIIAAFLAVLELVRLKEILIAQRQLFAEIEIMRNKENITVVKAP